jgi:hypothetical protein
MLGSKRVPLRFTRHVTVGDRVVVTDTIQVDGRVRLTDMAIGGEFFVRYVPQSRYFQSQELVTAPRRLSANELETLNSGHKLVLQRRVE